MKVAIIGYGAMGKKREAALGPDDEMIGWADDGSKMWPMLMDRADAVIIATPHEELDKYAHQALIRGKHVLVEKPGAPWAYRMQDLVAIPTRGVLHVGYNHRFHPGLRALKSSLGDEKPMLLRAYYGHGGRAGMEKEWRCDPAISGGGELLDQGSHLLDLTLWLMGGMPESVQGQTCTAFWDTTVDDNAAMLLCYGPKRLATLQVSWTAWRNTFELEVTTPTRLLKVTGLGGSYGVEEFREWHMVMGRPPDLGRWERFEQPDNSFRLEWEHFKRCCQTGESNAADAVRVLQIIDPAYARAPVRMAG